MSTFSSLSRLQHKLRLIRRSDGAELALAGPVKLPVQAGAVSATFDWYSWLNLHKLGIDGEVLPQALSSLQLADRQQSSVLVYGDFAGSEQALVRFHSICHTGDIFGSERCDCGFQLRESIRLIVRNGSGAIFYLADHEGRGIGLFAKTLAYALQELGDDTVEANERLGYPDDSRDYAEAASVLAELRSKPVTLITNNPGKLSALQERGIAVNGRIPIWGGDSKHNRRYLATKISKSGHLPGTKNRRETV